jgi:hypothetical protein
MVLWTQIDKAVLTAAMSLSQASTEVQEECDEKEAGQPLPQGLATYLHHRAMLRGTNSHEGLRMSITLASLFDVSNSHVPEPRTVAKRALVGKQAGTCFSGMCC